MQSAAACCNDALHIHRGCVRSLSVPPTSTAAKAGLEAATRLMAAKAAAAAWVKAGLGAFTAGLVAFGAAWLEALTDRVLRASMAGMAARKCASK